MKDRKTLPLDPVNYYFLENREGKRVLGRFYEEQLTKVNRVPNEWRVAKKLKYRKMGRRRQVQVNWQGYDPDFTSWISVKDLPQFQ